MNALNVMYRVRALLDEYTDDGVIEALDEVADINAKGLLFIDMAQKELFRTANIFKTHTITQKQIKNELGLLSNFDIVEFEGTDQYYPENGVTAKSYYFECDSDFTVVIQELESGAWIDLLEITDVITELTPYKGTFTPTTEGNLIRMKFTGDYFYRHKNRALFNIKFKPGSEAVYRPWVPYEMPNDFRQADSVIEEYPSRQYDVKSDAKWEGLRKLYVNFYFDGELRINYKPIPTDITDLEDELECDDTVANIIVYYVAAKLAPAEYPELTNFFEGKSNELKQESFVEMPASEQQIVDVYGGWNGNI